MDITLARTDHAICAGKMPKFAAGTI